MGFRVFLHLHCDVQVYLLLPPRSQHHSLFKGGFYYMTGNVSAVFKFFFTLYKRLNINKFPRTLLPYSSRKLPLKFSGMPISISSAIFKKRNQVTKLSPVTEFLTWYSFFAKHDGKEITTNYFTANIFSIPINSRVVRSISSRIRQFIFYKFPHSLGK